MHVDTTFDGEFAHRVAVAKAALLMLASGINNLSSPIKARAGGA
jgi:hypothetical protein